MEKVQETMNRKKVLIPFLTILLLISMALNGAVIYRMVSYTNKQKEMQKRDDQVKRGYVFNLESQKAISRNGKTFIPIDALNKVWIYEKEPYDVYRFWRYKEEEKKNEIIKKPVEAQFSENDESALIFYQGRQFLVPTKYVLVENSQQFIEEDALYEIFYKLYLVLVDKSKPIFIDPSSFNIKLIERSSETK